MSEELLLNDRQVEKTLDSAGVRTTNLPILTKFTAPSTIMP